MTKEDSLTIAVANYMRYQYPYVVFAHIPNGGSRNPIEGAKLKRMGVLKGMPDFLILVGKGDYTPAAFIELKIKPNKPTPAQKEVMSHLTELGWQGEVCYSFDEAKEFIDNYLRN